MPKVVELLLAAWLFSLACGSADASPQEPDWNAQPAPEFTNSQKQSRYLSCGCLQTDDGRYQPNGVFGITLHPVTVTNQCSQSAVIAGFREQRYEPNIPPWILRDGREYFRSEIRPGETLRIARQNTVIAYAVSPVCPSDQRDFVVPPLGGSSGLSMPPKTQTGQHLALIGGDAAPDFSQNYGSLARIAGARAGTGFVITTDGYVLTAKHLIGAAARPMTTAKIYGTTETLDADVVKESKHFDVALLKIRPVMGKTYRPVLLGSPFDAVAGSPTRTIGFGGVDDTDPPSLTNGAVTANCTPAQSRLWQMNNPITLGDSGGPLFDLTQEDPKVIGVGPRCMSPPISRTSSP